MLGRSLSPEECTSDKTLNELFAAATAKSPDNVALSSDGESVTYGRLDGWSSAVAELLHSYGVRRGDRVALRMAPSPEAVAAILGILKAGGAYVPLDIRNPAARNEFILSDSRPASFVGDPADCTLQGGVPLLSAEAVSSLRHTEAEGRAADSPEAPAGPRPDDTAYIIYTSGTTGRPKGVPVRHHNVTALLGAASRLFSFSAADRWLLYHSLAFDFSVWELWGPLSTGAELVILDHWVTRTPEEYLQVVRKRGVTVLNQTPTAFGALTAAVLDDGRDLQDLRYVIFGGEKLTPAIVRPWAKRFGLERPQLVNMYGITETTVHATFHAVTEADLQGEDSVIGRVLPGFTAKVVTESGQDAALGEVGELWLSGPQVTDGYLNRPELSAERFPMASLDAREPARFYRSGDLVSQRPGGDLVYRGRADLQVKLRGHRIELSDVEAAVRAHPEVIDAVAWVHDFAPGDTRLMCAFTSPQGERAPGRQILREHIAATLPSYMRPARYVPLPELPRTVNGKVDRAAVARSFEEGRRTMPGTQQKSRTEEIQSATLEWVAQLLEEPQVSAEDNFLDLGGHSMLALQLSGLSKERFGVEYDMRVLFEGTLADAAADVAARADKS